MASKTNEQASSAASMSSSSTTATLPVKHEARVDANNEGGAAAGAVAPMSGSAPPPPPSIAATAPAASQPIVSAPAAAGLTQNQSSMVSDIVGMDPSDMLSGPPGVKQRTMFFGTPDGWRIAAQHPAPTPAAPVSVPAPATVVPPRAAPPAIPAATPRKQPVGVTTPPPGLDMEKTPDEQHHHHNPYPQPWGMPPTHNPYSPFGYGPHPYYPPPHHNPYGSSSSSSTGGYGHPSPYPVQPAPPTESKGTTSGTAPEASTAEPSSMSMLEGIRRSNLPEAMKKQLMSQLSSNKKEAAPSLPPTSSGKEPHASVSDIEEATKLINEFKAKNPDMWSKQPASAVADTAKRDKARARAAGGEPLAPLRQGEQGEKDEDEQESADGQKPRKRVNANKSGGAVADRGCEPEEVYGIDRVRFLTTGPDGLVDHEGAQKPFCVISGRATTDMLAVYDEVHENGTMTAETLLGESIQHPMVPGTPHTFTPTARRPEKLMAFLRSTGRVLR